MPVIIRSSNHFLNLFISVSSLVMSSPSICQFVYIFFTLHSWLTSSSLPSRIHNMFKISFLAHPDYITRASQCLYRCHLYGCCCNRFLMAVFLMEFFLFLHYSYLRNPILIANCLKSIFINKACTFQNHKTWYIICNILTFCCMHMHAQLY